MPIKKVSGGYKYGESGKLYKGAGAKDKAMEQMKAIKASQAKKR